MIVDESGNGGGELFKRPERQRSDLASVRRALREGWPVSIEIRKECVDTALHILKHSEFERNKLGAIKALALLDRVNIYREQMESKIPDQVHQHLHINGNTPNQHRTTVARILNKLGGPTGPDAAKGSTDGNGRPDGGGDE